MRTGAAAGVEPGMEPPADFLAAKSRRVRAARLALARTMTDAATMRAAAMRLAPPASFAAALRAGEHVAVIAEFKRRSPSGGALVTTASPADIARSYAAAGAAALSVLTDAEDFDGTLDDLQAATRAAALPALCKDFVVDEARLCEARSAGAAAILLIVRMLSADELGSLLCAARDIGLECLVEVHDERELDSAGAAGATLIGINNRDLATLTTDLRVTARLARRAPAAATLVSESGLRTADDVARVRDAGAHAVLVGEALLRAGSHARPALLRALAGVRR